MESGSWPECTGSFSIHRVYGPCFIITICVVRGPAPHLILNTATCAEATACPSQRSVTRLGWREWFGRVHPGPGEGCSELSWGESSGLCTATAVAVYVHTVHPGGEAEREQVGIMLRWAGVVCVCVCVSLVLITRECHFVQKENLTWAYLLDLPHNVGPLNTWCVNSDHVFNGVASSGSSHIQPHSSAHCPLHPPLFFCSLGCSAELVEGHPCCAFPALSHQGFSPGCRLRYKDVRIAGEKLTYPGSVQIPSVNRRSVLPTKPPSSAFVLEHVSEKGNTHGGCDKRAADPGPENSLLTPDPRFFP